MAEGFGAVQESLLQEITCNICLRHMVDPRALPCTHVYCNECLKRLVQRSQDTQGCLQCPECRKTVQMPTNDTAEFPKDFRTARLKEVYEKMLQIDQSTCSPTTSILESSAESTLKCQIHGSPIEMYCISCKDILCQECVRVHENHKYDYLIEKNVTRKSINLTEHSETHKNILNDNSLPRYDAAMKEYDDQARKTQEMVIESDYSCVSIGFDVLQEVEQYENQRQRLEATMTEVEQCKSKVSTAIVDVVQTQVEMDSQARTCQVQLDAAFEGMIEILQNKWQQLRSEVADELSEKSSILSQQKEGLSLLFEEINSVLIACTSQTALQDHESIQQRLANLQQRVKTTALKPAVTADVGASLTEGDLMKTCCNHCALKYRIPDTSKYKLMGKFLKSPETDKTSEINIELCDSKGNLCPGLHKIKATLIRMRDSKVTTVSSMCKGVHSLSFTPLARGRHVLNVILDNIPHPQCPIALFVKKKPETLRDPCQTIANPNGPMGLHFYNDQLVVSEETSCTVSFMDRDGNRTQTIKIGGEATFDTESQCFFIANPVTHQLHKLNANGVCLKQVGTQVSDPSQLRTRGMQFYNGELYVVDSKNHRIHVFDKDLQYQRHLGEQGTNNGYFRSPTDVAIDNTGKLYITDTLNNRIQVMNHEGKFIRNITKTDKQRQYQYPHMPQKITISRGYIYTTEYQMNSVCVFTMAGDLVTTFGQEHIIHPEGIAIDKDGYVYVTSNKENIVVF